MGAAPADRARIVSRSGRRQFGGGASWRASTRALIKYAAYLICAFCAAWAGVVLTADTHTSDPVSVGLYIELDAILAVVIGGGSLSGGRIYLGTTSSGRW